MAHLQRFPPAIVHAPAFSGLRDHCFRDAVGWPGRDCLGQILFGWKTPENIAAVNAQNQTTLHNLEFFQNYLDLNLFLVSVVLLVLVLWRPSIRRMRTTILDEGRIPNSNFFIPRYFWPLFFCAAFLSYFVATESGTELVINIDQEWAEFLLYLAAGLNLLRTYILLGNAQPQPSH